MPVTFSSYLQMIRDKKNLTQQHLLELLVKSNDAFSKLDLTTLSRWERGVTTPKLEKQLLVARLLDSDVAMLINPDVHIPKTKLHMVDKVRYRTLNPYSADKTLFKMTTFVVV
jgi:transcriptional regulator with XRE-family HTH domain